MSNEINQMHERLTKFNPETNEYEHKERAKTQAEFIAQRKAVIQRLGEYEDRAKGEWISVDERLPEKDGDYITFTNATGGGGVIAMRFVTTTVRRKTIRRWEWYGRISPWLVTHWMPLPQPPKTKGECDEQR